MKEEDRQRGSVCVCAYVCVGGLGTRMSEDDGKVSAPSGGYKLS